MNTFGQKLGRVLSRKDILSLCVMILTADVVSGIIAPNFALFATGIGASMALVGALTAVEGLSRIIVSVPIGLFSDRHGRKPVLVAGMLFFALASLGYTWAPNAYWLLPLKALVGVAMVATFFVGIAYIGDVVESSERGLVIGLYSTFMGSGFAVGSAIGGAASSRWGFAGSYYVAAAVALLGAGLAAWGLRDRAGTHGPTTGGQARGGGDAWALLTHSKPLLAASVANLCNNMWYSGLVASFFAVYAASLGIGTAAIGSMFALRAVLSTVARLPTGLASGTLSARRLMLIALALAAVAIIGIQASTAAPLLTALLAVEGVAYGMFLTSGQAFVTHQFSDEMRGTAVGVYSTAGGIGSTGGPFLLGVIAEVWGLRPVFWTMAVLIVLGIAIILAVAQPSAAGKEEAVHVG
ncbi:MAG: MFS transporter [Anaerolineales bacterium]